MTRKELEAAYVEQGIAKWGEAERDGLIAQAKRKHIDTLRYDVGTAADQAKADAKFEKSSKTYQALGCLDDGPT